MTLFKKYLIALCDGHGMETAGKRTPKFDDGTFMKENEFNREVVGLLDIYLQYNGFDTLLVAPTDEDTSLKDRVDLANSKKADLYISVHANAFSDVWSDANGIETYHYPNSINGKRLAETIHKHMLKNTELKDRGIKTANFYVLKYTNMPATLVESGFMSNKREALLLMSHEYRNECAREICEGICEYFGIEYKELKEEKAEKYLELFDRTIKIERFNDIEYIRLNDIIDLIDIPVKEDSVEVVEESKDVIYMLLKKGMKGADVKILQEKLNQLGYNCGTADGDFGTKTYNSVISFQKTNGLVADGIVGNQTWSKIDELLKKGNSLGYTTTRESGYINIVKIELDKIKKLDLVVNAKLETMSTTYSKLTTKPTFMINGGLFMSDGRSLNLLYSNGKLITEGCYSRFGLQVFKDGKFGFGTYTTNSNLFSMIGGSPSLIQGGKVSIDKGKMEDSLINNRHPRSAVGMDDKYLYLIAVDGRQTGKQGMTINELANYMLKLGCKNAVNLDGGGSTRLTKNNVVVNSPTENRAIANSIYVCL